MSPQDDSPEAPSISDWNRHEICDKLEWEGGLDFLVNGGEGSDFPQIEDSHFHELRRAFVKAANELEAYIRYNDWSYDEEDGSDEKPGD